MSHAPDSQDLPDDLELVVIPSTAFQAWAEDFALAAVALRERAARIGGEAETLLAEQLEEMAHLAEQREVAAAAGIDVDSLY